MENMIKIIHQSQKFPLLISEKLEKKIRVLCNKFPKTEWSGQLFYTFTGSFEKGDIAFIAEDLLFMDTGCGTATEFYLDECNAAAYMADHELWNCQMGLIHSHNAMQAFFSGQDDTMLLQEGSSRNHFLSLVVNNDGNYVARVTVKETYESTVRTTKKFKTFGDKEVKQSLEEEPKISEFVSTYDLEITKNFELVCDDYEELMETIKQCDEIKKKRIERERKEEEKEKKYNPSTKLYSIPAKSYQPFQPDKESQNFNKRNTQSVIPFNEYNEEEIDPFNPSQGNIDKVLTKEEIKYYATKIMYLGLLDIDANKFNYFVSNIDKIMAKRFKNMETFKDALSVICDYLLDTEMLNTFYDKYSPDICDEAYYVAKLQIAEYFTELIQHYPNSVYLQEIYNYITI